MESLNYFGLGFPNCWVQWTIFEVFLSHSMFLLRTLCSGYRPSPYFSFGTVFGVWLFKFCVYIFWMLFCHIHGWQPILWVLSSPKLLFTCEKASQFYAIPIANFNCNSWANGVLLQTVPVKNCLCILLQFQGFRSVCLIHLKLVLYNYKRHSKHTFSTL